MPLLLSRQVFSSFSVALKPAVTYELSAPEQKLCPQGVCSCLPHCKPSAAAETLKRHSHISPALYTEVHGCA